MVLDPCTRLCGNKVGQEKTVWLFCGLDDEVVWLFRAALEEDWLLREEAKFTLEVLSKRRKKWGQKSRWVCNRIGSPSQDGNLSEPHILSFTFTQYYIGHEIVFSYPYGIKS